MKNNSFSTVRTIIAAFIAVLTFNAFASATATFRTASGANAAAIQVTVDQFRADLGGVNNGVGSSFTNGRREINWDGVPDSFSAPNFFPANFFNANSPRGIMFGTPTSNIGNDTSNFIVSATQASSTAVRFGNIDASYSTVFQTFSAQRLFVPRSTSDNTNSISIQFFIPGTNIPATVSGFGAVFCDIDDTANTMVRVYGIDGRLLASPGSPSIANNGLSFFGVSFNAGERIARVEIILGNKPLAAGNVDGTNGVDVVAFDDFIYGEPRAAEYHASDFDGDGTSDFAVYRPSAGAWFVLNSGSNTFQAFTFGTNGDIPVEGDFDGDRRTDITVFRPSTGTWFRLDSSNNGFSATNFGTNGDKPSPGDYDKDGKTDIAVWRPSSGSYFILRSSNGAFQATQWGANGDIPIAASPGP